MNYSSSVQVFTTFIAALLVATASSAQTRVGSALSSPIASPTAPPVATAGASAPASTQAPVGMGGVDLSGRSGPGVHSPLSQFQPLADRNDVIAWSLLTKVQTKTEGNKVFPVHTAATLALNQKKQRVQGFMMPLQPGERQTHFLLSQVPLSCGFCTPGGPESMIEVRSKTPVKFGMDVVVVEGTFRVLQDDPYGLFYRMTDAVQVK